MEQDYFQKVKVVYVDMATFEIRFLENRVVLIGASNIIGWKNDRG